MKGALRAVAGVFERLAAPIKFLAGIIKREASTAPHRLRHGNRSTFLEALRHPCRSGQRNQRAERPVATPHAQPLGRGRRRQRRLHRAVGGQAPLPAPHYLNHLRHHGPADGSCSLAGKSCLDLREPAAMGSSGKVREGQTASASPLGQCGRIVANRLGGLQVFGVRARRNLQLGQVVFGLLAFVRVLEVQFQGSDD